MKATTDKKRVTLWSGNGQRLDEFCRKMEFKQNDAVNLFVKEALDRAGIPNVMELPQRKHDDRD